MVMSSTFVAFFTLFVNSICSDAHAASFIRICIAVTFSSCLSTFYSQRTHFHSLYSAVFCSTCKCDPFVSGYRLMLFFKSLFIHRHIFLITCANDMPSFSPLSYVFHLSHLLSLHSFSIHNHFILLQFTHLISSQKLSLYF